MTFKVLATLIAVLFPLTGVSAVYRCTDAQGKVVFSDTPCTQSSQMETVDTRTGAGAKADDDNAQPPSASGLERWQPRAPLSEKSSAAPKPSDFTLQVEKDFIRAMTANTDQAVTGSKGGLVQVWNLQGGNLLKQYSLPPGGILSLAMLDNKIVVGLDNPAAEQNLQVRDLGQDNSFKPLAGQTGAIQSLAAADGKIASYALTKTIGLWDSKTQRLLKEIKVEAAESNPTTLHVALGDGLVAASLLRTINVWDSDTGELLVRFTAPGNVYALALGGGKLLAAAGSRNVLVWNPRTGQALEPLQGHTQWVSSVAVKNNRIISGSFDNTVNIWDLETGQHIRTLRAKDKIYEVAAAANAVLARVNTVVEVWNNALK